MKKLTILIAVVFISLTSVAQNDIDNVFYLRVGYSSPSWEQFGFTKDNLKDYSKGGALLEMGKIYMLNGISLSDKMALGINVDFLSIYWHQFISDNDFVDIGTLRLDSKIGPSFTISPVKNIAFDVYVKADISWVTASVFMYDYDNEDYDGYGGLLQVGVSTGFNVRLRKLMLGVEYNSISPKLEDVDNEGDYLGNAEDQSNKTPLPSVTFSIGLAF